MHCRTTTGMMERCNVRLLYGCMFLALFLCLVEVSDTVPVKKPDENLCDASKFLHETNVTKHPCEPSDSEDYKNLLVRYENMDKFLCVLIEDTTHKICSNNSTLWTNLNSIAYYTYMQRLNSQKEINDVTFCQYLEGVTSIYEKSNPTLLQLIESVNKPKGCGKVCFNADTTIYPVCSMLGWIKSSHDNIIQTVITEQTIPVPLKETQTHAKGIDKSNSQHVITHGTETELLVPKEAPHEQSSTDNKIDKLDSVMNKVEIKANPQPQIHITVPTKSNQSFGNPTDPPVNAEKPETKDNKIVHVPSDATPVKIESTDAGLHAKEKVDDSIDRPAPSITQSAYAKNEEGKTDIISDNTQDHQSTGNEDENSRIDDEHIPYGQEEDITSERDNQNPDLSEISDQRHEVSHFHNVRTEDESHFFTYFTVISVVFIGGCIAYHNKQKILAIVLEGRRSKNSRGRRRPSTASYRKLDCTLEEAVTSQCNANVTHVIY